MLGKHKYSIGETQELTHPDYELVDALDINERGQVLVQVVIPRPDDGDESYDIQAAIWENSSLQILELPYLGYASGACINDKGVVVIEYVDLQRHKELAFAWIDGTLIDLSEAIGVDLFAVRGINNHNQLVCWDKSCSYIVEL